jgi:predicted ribosomally synthesized peptide with SipW-like signal peptide
MSVCAAGALAVVMVVAATFAWFTAHDSVTNSLEIAQITDGSVSLVGVFDPAPDWRPGQAVVKQIAVVNHGGGGVLARVSFEEVMTKLELPATEHEGPISGSQIPQFFDASLYLQAPYQDVADLTMSHIDTAGATQAGLPTGMSVKMYEVVAGDRTSRIFVALHSLDGVNAGKYQRVTADFNVQGNSLILSNIKYWAFDSVTMEQAAWATFTHPKTNATPVTRPLAEIEYPETDKAKQNIKLTYTDKDSLSQPTDNKWHYNAEDGFFYYIGKIQPGGTTTQLLSSLSLEGEADGEYSGAKFDLIVNLEAIQNTEAAITADSGWGLTNTALIEALRPHCD